MPVMARMPEKYICIICRSKQRGYFVFFIDFNSAQPVPVLGIADLRVLLFPGSAKYPLHLSQAAYLLIKREREREREKTTSMYTRVNPYTQFKK